MYRGIKKVTGFIIIVIGIQAMVIDGFDKIAIVALFILQLGFTYLEPMQFLFGTTAIGIEIWLRILLASSSMLFLVELEKYFMRKVKIYVN